MRVATLLLSLLACVMAAAAGAAERFEVGSGLPDFSLRDYRGKVHDQASFDEASLLVVAFLGNDCPLARLYGPRLAALADEYAAQGVRFVGVNSNVQDTPTEIGAFAQRYGIDFPLLKDAGNVLADQLSAQRAPAVLVFDADRKLRYRGRIDDQYGVGYQRSDATRNDLATALDELLAGQDVSVAQTEAPGCIIGRVQKIEPRGDVTFNRDVAPILNRRCVECHREGELAPFPLTSYDEVVGWGEMICEVVSLGRMPPWFANPEHGTFSNDCSMSDNEKQVLHDWVAGGSPEGEPDDLPASPEFVTGWNIGEPDAVYTMPEPFDVPAEGVIDYQYFLIDPGFEEDVWVSAAEARPDNTAVVHHIVLFAAPSNFDVDRAAQNGGPAGGQMVAIYAPGMRPWQYPEGTAMKIRKGAKFVVQMHYTSCGTPQTDQSYVGLNFVDESEVRKRIRYGMAINFQFEIPPGADNHIVTSKSTMRRDTTLLQLFPHMHYRGKAFRFEAHYPDGTQEVLLDVPHYDFNWQLRYDLAEPKHLPRGTELHCTAVYDNSEENLVNPDPDETVRFGLQSFEEMMVGYYTSVRTYEDLTQDE